MSMKFVEKKSTLAEAVEEAWDELQILAEEMREAFDNTPESLQGSGAGEKRGEAADALEDLSEPSVPEALKLVEVTYYVPASVPKRGLSRSARRDHACGVLDRLVEVLNEKEENKEAMELAQELEELKDNAEAVEFPGMFG